jgi:XTP/dITP diphosphohydrolase
MVNGILPLRIVTMKQKKEEGILFVSSNSNKYQEIKPILDINKIKSHFVKMSLQEIQSESVYSIAKQKSKYAFEQVVRPVIIEDDGFYIRSLKGFPGQYSSFVFRTLGNRGILRLMEDRMNRRAHFLSVIGYYDGHTFKSFSGITEGLISEVATKSGWGFDPIFIPDNTDKTYAELGLLNRKVLFSHRSKSINRFSEWYVSR